MTRSFRSALAPLAALALAGCTMSGTPRTERPGVVIDATKAKPWAPTDQAAGGPAGGTGPVEADERSVLASLTRRTAELHQALAEVERLRAALQRERERADSSQARLERVDAQAKELAARLAESDAERKALLGRALDSEMNRLLAEQRLVELRLAELDGGRRSQSP